MRARIWVIGVSTLGSAAVLLALVLLMLPGTEASVRTAIVVDTLEDVEAVDGACSLREAIEAANTNTAVDACPAGDEIITDTITFQVAGTITLTDQITVTGRGPLAIDGGQVITISGNNQVRAFWLANGTEVALRRLVVEKAKSFSDEWEYGGAIYNLGVLSVIESAFRGCAGLGAIYNSGTLAVTDSEFHGNSGGAIRNSGVLSVNQSVFSGGSGSSGGAVINEGRMIMISSTVVGNHAYGLGGGILNTGTASITATAILSNSACFIIPGGQGGGVYNSGKLSLANSTVSGNSACNLGTHCGGIDSRGRLMVTNSTLSRNYGNLCCVGCRLHNTIVSRSWGQSGDCEGTIIDGGYNIDSDGSCGFDPANGSMPNTNPLLDALDDNGGPTLTLGLLPASPAIDAGDPALCPAADQRGAPRPLDGDGDGYATCDIGSFELDFVVFSEAYPDPAISGGPLTYTLHVYNGWSPTATATISDILPAQVSPAGTLVWTPVTILPGDTWSETVVVTVEAGYQGLITNVLQASSVEGRSGSHTLSTPVYGPPQADFTAEPTLGPPPLTVAFANLSSGGYDTSWWHFGDGITSTMPNPTHTYTALEAYTVTLTVEGPGGTDTEIKERYISVHYGVYLPLVLRGT